MPISTSDLMHFAFIFIIILGETFTFIFIIFDGGQRSILGHQSSEVIYPFVLLFVDWLILRDACVEIREQIAGVGSLLPLVHGLWR